MRRLMRNFGRWLGIAAIAVVCLHVAPVWAGSAKGRLTYDGKVYDLQHVYAWQPLFQDRELWIYLTDRALPTAAAPDDEAVEDLARGDRFGGIKLIVEPTRPRLDDIRGIVYAPRDGLFSLDKFNFGPSWQTLAIEGRKVSGTARTKWMNWTLEVEFTTEVEGSTGTVQTMTGAEAQGSPQAAAFVAFEQALMERGIDAAGHFMTPEKLADMRDRMQRLGEASFKEFQAARRARTPQGEARRQQVERVDVDGDYAEIGARSGDRLDTALLVKTKGGWRIVEW